MASRKPKASKVQTPHKKPPADAAALVQKRVEASAEMRLVLEIAARARAAESNEPPRHIGIATDIVATPTNSQYPV